MLARWSAVIGFVAVASLLLGLLVSNTRLLSPLAGLGIAAAGGALGILGLLLGVIAAFRGGIAAAIPGLALGALVAIPSFVFVLRATHYPPINDITTDTASPPEFTRAPALPENHGRDFTYPGDSFARLQRAAYPEIQPLVLDKSPMDVFELVETEAEAKPDWQITFVDREMLILEGVAETSLFRFRDDFLIQVRPFRGGSMVQMRSRSRVGKGDLGVNARRITGFFSELKRQAAF